VGKNWKEDLAAAVDREDDDAILTAARERVSRVVRFLSSQLYTPEADVKRKTIRALGVVAAEKSLLDHQRTTDLLRRFVWALNDESGAVPYGMPEAIGELLANRPEFQEAFLPILCSLLTEDDMSQTGPVERGAFWAVGRVGAPVAKYSQDVVEAVRRAAESHAEPDTSAVARESLTAIMGSTPNEHS
jgi:hypothetical protein